MAFGKKKEKKKNKKAARDVAVKEIMGQNPLYPDKQESAAKEVLTALGTSVICLFLVGIIFTNFSYAMNPEAYEEKYSSSYSGEEIYEDIEEVTNAETDTEESFMEDQTDTEETVIEGDYVIPDSSSRYISTSELEGLSKEQLTYARNEIYARHGRLFKDQGIQAYFNSKSWYNGTISPDSFSEGMLNDYEIKNAETILSYEKSKGYR